MKKSLLFLFTVLCTLCIFVSCSDDKDDEVVGPAKEVNGEYTSASETNKLMLTYSGQVLLGKSVAFNSTDGKTATLTLKGDMSALWDIIGSIMGSKSSEVLPMSPGVIPGEVITSIADVKLTSKDNKYTFEGVNTQNGREIKYTGEVEKGKLTLALTVKMPDNKLLGAWKLAPFVPGQSQPLFMTWKSNASINLGEGPVPTDMLAAKGATVMSGLLTTVLQDVTFKDDGNIVATYSKQGSDEWVSSPINLAQYYIKDSKVFVVLNLDMIIKTVAKNKTKALDINQILSLLVKGVPLSFEVNADTAKIYADKEFLFSVFNIVLGAKDMIYPMLPEDMKPLIDALLPQIVTAVQSTSELNIGLNLNK